MLHNFHTDINATNTTLSIIQFPLIINKHIKHNLLELINTCWPVQRLLRQQASKLSSKTSVGQPANRVNLKTVVQFVCVVYTQFLTSHSENKI